MYIDPQNEDLIASLAELTPEQLEWLRTLVHDGRYDIPSVIKGLDVAHSLACATDLDIKSGHISVAMLLICGAEDYLERMVKDLSRGQHHQDT